MTKFKKVCTVISQLVYCVLCLYSFAYCCYCSIKPIRTLFLKLTAFKNLFFEIPNGMIYFYFPLLFLGIIAIVILFIAYKKSKIMVTSITLTILIIGILVYTFAIASSDIFYSNIKYLYWILCFCLFSNTIYSIYYFVKNKQTLNHSMIKKERNKNK